MDGFSNEDLVARKKALGKIPQEVVAGEAQVVLETS
jgi:hypothetical protein